MFQKFLAAFMSLIMICTFTGVNVRNVTDSATEVIANDTGPIVTIDGELVIAETEADGVTVKCVHDKSTDEYSLYLDEEKCAIDVNIEDDIAYVYLKTGDTTNDAVVGQSLGALAITAGYWTPAIIAAVKVVVGLATARIVYISIDLIATTINNVKSGRITKSNLKSRTLSRIRALDVVATMKKDNRNYYYYEAILASNGQVLISSYPIR